MKRILYIFLFLTSGLAVNAQTLLDEAVELNVKDIQGNVYSLFEILDSGKHVVIDFYSASCGYCQLYAPDVQASYVKFGENNGDVFFMTIDKGHTNAEIAEFDETYGVTMPSISGMEGGGNNAHLLFEIQATPSVILIAPDHTILEHMIWPATTENIDTALLNAGLTMVGVDVIDVSEKPSIYPNPVTDKLFVDVSNIKDPSDVALFDMLGNKRASVDIHIGQIIEIPDIINLPQGIYFISVIYDNDKMYTQKVIISE